MSAIPISAPPLSAKDAYSETAGRASLLRRLARWQTWAWARWRRYGPCDPLALDLTGSPAWPTSCSSSTPTRFPWIFVWESGTGALTVKLWCYVTRNAGSTTGKIDLADGVRNQMVATVNINDTTLGSGVLAGWVSADVPIVGPNTLVPTLSRTSGSGTVSWFGASGWWNAPPHDLGTLAWQPLSQAWAAAQKPLSAYVVRRLVEQAAYLQAYSPRPVVQKWWGPGMYVTTSTAGPYTETIGRYMVPFSPRSPSVDFLLHMRGDLNGGGPNQPAVFVIVNGVSGSPLTPTTAWAWHTKSYTYGLTTENVYEVSIQVIFDTQALAGDQLRIASFCAYEPSTALTAAQLGLPGSETVPAAYSALDYSRIGARTPIYADQDSDGRPVGLAQIVRDMVWLHANRRGRNLIADGTRWAGHAAGGGSASTDGYPLNDGASDSTLCAAYRWGKSPDLSAAYNYASWLARTIAQTGWTEVTTAAAFLEGYVAGSRYGGRVYGGAAKFPDLAWGWVEDDARGLGWTGNNGAPQTYWGKSPDPTTGSGGNRNPLYSGQATREKHGDEPVWTNP